MQLSILNISLNDLDTYGFKVFELIGGRCLFGITYHYVEKHLELNLLFTGIDLFYGKNNF